MSLLLLLKGAAKASAEPQPFIPYRRPSLELDIEIETADGAIFRLSADDLKATNIPTGITFGTQRGDGFGTASFTLARNILKDYPDINLLDTVRFVGRQGDIAYEGRIHSFPKSNDPMHQINVSCVGWMTYLKSKPIAPLIIDRRLGGWTDPSTQRTADLLKGSYDLSKSSAKPQAGGEGPPAILIEFSSFTAGLTEITEQWLFAGGEDIDDFRYDFIVPRAGGEAGNKGLLASNDVAGSILGASSDHKTAPAAAVSVQATGPGAKYAVIQSQYPGAFAGASAGDTYGFAHPRIVGTHGLTARGVSPEEGYYISDIITYLLRTYYPKIDTSGVQQNVFELMQAAWQDSPSDGYRILQQLNDLVLWETNMWEDRKLHFEPTDLSVYDWVLRTDDPGVTVMWQGDSIENFANGVVVTYSDFFGRTYTLYPDEHPELADESEDNPATRHGEELWVGETVPFKCLEAEALQYGRAYLAEYNRPKRPGTYRVAGGYIKDGAGHERQGWAVRNSSTLGVLDHPQDFPRLITATNWVQDGTALDITVDAPPSTLAAVTARHELALQARNL